MGFKVRYSYPVKPIFFLFVLLFIILGRASFYIANSGKWVVFEKPSANYKIQYPATWYEASFKGPTEHLTLALDDLAFPLLYTQRLLLYAQNVDDPTIGKATEWGDELIDLSSGTDISDIQATLVGRNEAHLRFFTSEYENHAHIYLVTEDMIYLFDLRYPHDSPSIPREMKEIISTFEFIFID